MATYIVRCIDRRIAKHLAPDGEPYYAGQRSAGGPVYWSSNQREAKKFRGRESAIRDVRQGEDGPAWWNLMRRDYGARASCDSSRRRWRDA